MKTISDQIDALACRRQFLLSNGGGAPGEIDSISKKLTDLYEARRAERATETSGGFSRSEITRRARLDTELERLMSG